MTTVQDIYDHIDSFAPFSSAEDWDNVGILVGNKNEIVKKALVALDITNAVVDEARETGAQLIISHHPIIFGGTKRVLSDSPVYRAASFGISCLCAHTNLDKSTVFGVNTVLAESCGLTNCRMSESSDIMFIADTDTLKPLTAKELAAIIKKNIGMDAIAYTDSGKGIATAAICSGAGGSEIFAAADEGADAFITGEIKHHELIFANEVGISVFILGHYKSEDVVIQPLADRLSKKFPETDFIKSRVFTDGVVTL